MSDFLPGHTPPRTRGREHPAFGVTKLVFSAAEKTSFVTLDG